MNRSKHTLISAALFTLAACGSGKSGSSTTGAAASTTGGSASTTTTTAAAGGSSGSHGTGAGVGAGTGSTTTTTGVGATSSGSPGTTTTNPTTATTGNASSSSSGGSNINWTQIAPGDGGSSWADVIFAGSNLLAVGSGYGTGIIAVSTNNGSSWTNTTPPPLDAGPGIRESWGQWSAAASSTDGTKLATIGSGFVWTSTNSGTSWTSSQPSYDGGPNGPTFFDWSDVASDSTGEKLVAVADSSGGRIGGIWTSTNGGSDWTNATPSLSDGGGPVTDWEYVVSDSTGANLIATTNDHSDTNYALWTSSNGGSSWSPQPNLASQTYPWGNIASDSTGQKLITTISLSGIWLSTNGGATWSQPTLPSSVIASIAFGTCASSADGTHLVVGTESSGILESTDSGATWSVLPTLPNQDTAGSISINAAGTIVVTGFNTNNGLSTPDIFVD